MAISYIPTLASVASVGAVMWGDGTSLSLVLDLTAPPFGISFGRNFPFIHGAFNFATEIGGNVDPSFSAVASLVKAVLALTFNKPIPPFVDGQNQQSSFTVNFEYQG